MRVFQTLQPSALEHVTGGRHTQGPPQIDPSLVQAIGELAKAVQGVGQNLAQAKQANAQQAMGAIQQLMQAKGGGK